MNVALYSKGANRWAMTERNAKSLRRSANHLQIGPSTLHWDGERLTAEINEICAPLPYPLRGKITLTPGAIHDEKFALDAEARHTWRPIAPRSRIRIDFDKPGLAWSGNAYLDSNEGAVPLATDFSEWNWSRSHSSIFYDVTRVDGSKYNLALKLEDGGSLPHFSPPAITALPNGAWGVSRASRADENYKARVVKTLTDAPFYTRSLVDTKINGEAILCVHESLSLKRFTSPIVQMMLPFRMPRFR